MIILKDFTVGDAVLACHMLRALAEKSPSPTAAQALRELADVLMAGADAEVNSGIPGAEDIGDLEDIAIAAAIDWARFETAANKAADDLASAVRTHEETTGAAIVRIVNGIMQPTELGAQVRIDLSLHALDLAAASEQSAMQALKTAALALLCEDQSPTTVPTPTEN